MPSTSLARVFLLALALVGLLATAKHGPLFGLYTLAALATLRWAAICERRNGRPLWPLLPRNPRN